MFLGCRSTQAEYFDLPGRTESEIRETFRDLDRLNRFFVFSRPFEDVLPPWLGLERCARLDILDIGAGTGLLGQLLSAWAAKRGWDWRCTSLDTNFLGLRQGNSSRRVAGSALALPVKDGSFDVVVSSQMAHHLTDDQVVSHLREGWRATRSVLMISDLHRNAGLYAMLWFSTRLMGISQPVQADALLSVQRGFHRPELSKLASRAGLTDAKVWVYFGTRILLQARK